MEIRTFSLDPDLTVAEIDPGTENAWHFLPFEDRRGDLVALDEQYIMAIGRHTARNKSVAIFDRVERRRTNIETNDRLWIVGESDKAPSWCYAPAHRSVFIVEFARKFDGKYPNPWQYLRQLSVDGSVNRRILIAPDFSARVVLPRDDGRIICVGGNQVAALDPVSGDAQLSATDRIMWTYPSTIDTELRWFSPDGRWALRPHLGSIIRSGKPPGSGSRAGSFLSRIFPGKEAALPAEEAHPDLPGDGVRRFGLALELFRLDPIAFERRLIIRYVNWPGESAAILDALADQQDHRTWNGDDLLLNRPEDTPETRMIKAVSDWVERVEWDDDGQGFTVAWVQGTREVPSPLYAGRFTERVTDLSLRHVSLDGAVGPIIPVPGEPKASAPLPTETAIKAIKALVRERSSQVVECGGSTGADLAATLREMRRRIEERGLDQLVFGGQVQFRFRTGGRSVGEKKFFETVRGMPANEVAPILPELRHLLKSYGSAARNYQKTGYWPIASGPSDDSPAAMAEAALTLAMLDDTGFDALRDWVVTVAQEHDYFAAAKVFPAIVRRTGFATAEAVRFGLWFFLQQWQTVKYEKTWLGLFKAAPAVMTPALFAAAVLEEAQDVNSFSDATSPEGSLTRVQEMLGRTFWDRAVSAELDRQLATIDGRADD